jgi:hypothetical protein
MMKIDLDEEELQTEAGAAMTEMPDIPDFLKVANRVAPANPVKLAQTRRKAERKRPFHLPKTIEPAGLQLLKQIEDEKKRKREERFRNLT